LFPLSLLGGFNIGQTVYRSLECLRIFREKDHDNQQRVGDITYNV